MPCHSQRLGTSKHKIANDRRETVTINVTVKLLGTDLIDFSPGFEYTGHEGGVVVSHLALYLLGPPRIERDGVPIRVDTRKAIALLAYIAVTGESHRRASLINLLWPEYDRSRGRAALRRTLYALNKAFAGDWLDVDREEIGLDPSADIWLDVDRFHRHLAGCEAHGHPTSQVCSACVAPLSDAVALYRDDFLTGFGLKDSVNFDDWQFFQTEALRRELAGVLERLVHWHSAQREFEPALGYAKRRLALDPLDEEAHCELMRLYTWSGQRSAALRQYQECLEVLHDQLGVSPQETTAQLYHAIKEGQPPPLPVSEPSEPRRETWDDSKPSPPAVLPDLPAQLASFPQGEEPGERPVFVARERELAQLAGFLDVALAGQGRVAFVTGDAGQGKTALIREFARRAQATHADLVVACGHGNAHTGMGDPYLPFREVLGLLTGDVEAWSPAGAMTQDQARRLWYLLPLAMRALMEAGPDLVDLFVPGAALVKRAAAFTQRKAGSEWLTQLEALVERKAAIPNERNLQQSALFEQFTQVLRALAHQRPLLITLDDLQWADGGSINLLFHLGRRLEHSRILILGAYRATEVILGRPSTEPPGQESLNTRQRERHPLEPVVNEFKRHFGQIEVDLEQAQGRQFVDAFLDSEPNQLDEAFRETLFHLTKGHPLFTVELLRGMQERQELAQDRKGRWVEGEVLNWETLPARVEAVIAERISRLPERLRNVLNVASVEGEAFTAEVIARVETASERETVRLLSDVLDRTYQLVSAQRTLRLEGQRLSRYRFRHTLFQRYLYNSLDPVEKEYLHQAVGTWLEKLCGEGTEEAAAAAPQLAWHFQEAGSTEKAIGYLCLAGERAQRLYANEEAIRYFVRSLELLEDTLPTEADRRWQRQMASRLQENLGDVLEWTGEHEKATAAYQKALNHAPEGDLMGQSRLHRKVGNIWRLRRRYEQALQAYELAELTHGEGSPESASQWWQERIQIQLERMWLYYWLGQWQEIADLADQIRPAVEQHGTPSQCVNFFLCLASMNNRRDRYVVSEETLSFCEIALAISQESENLGEIAWARFMLGFTLLWHGDLGEAEKQMQVALALAEQTGDVVHQSRCLTYLTILYRKRGQLEETRHCASQSLEVARAGHMIEYIGMAQANLAWLACHEGNLSQTEANGQAALELWQKLPASHSSCAFQWAALWPLIDVALAENRMDDAISYAQAMFEDTQQRLPQALVSIVEKAIETWKQGEQESAYACLDRAKELARELGYH
jgi:DNA-binding SARP family transcriptional activator